MIRWVFWVMKQKNMVKIVQINLGRRSSALGNLNDLISKRNYEIALIQEPYTYKKIISKTNTDGIILQNSEIDETPRACIWINKLLYNESEAIQLLDYSDRDCVAVKLTLNEIEGKKEIVICSAYCPGRQEAKDIVVSEKLKMLIKYCKTKHIELVVGCDANAHNTVWGSKKDCSRGIKLLEFLTINDLFLINEGNMPTWERNELMDVIDLTFATRILSTKILFWRVLDETSDSDHNFISMEIKTQPIKTKKLRNRKKTNWMNFRSQLKNFLSKPVGIILNEEDLEREAKYLTTSIVESYHNNCKPYVRKNNFKMKWQNISLSKLKKDVRRLHNRAKRINNTQARNDWRSKRDEYFKKCKKAQFECWKKDMEELEEVKDVARLQKLLEKRKNKKIGNLKRNDGTYTRSCEENNMELLKCHFPNCEIYDSSSTHQRSSNHNNFNNENDTDYISKLTTMEKIHWAVNSFSPYKSPGEDKIFPALLQKSIDLIDKRLQTLFRESLRLSYIPLCWRGVSVVFIPKPGKPNYETAKAYRPISLMSFILKTLEKLIDKSIRLVDMKTKTLNPKQYAYQEGKSTETALHNFVSFIDKTFSEKKMALAVFIDIEVAFDNTAFSTIEKAARDRGINNIAIE